MTKAYSYIRMSSAKQLEGDSLARQLELSEAFAALHDLDLDTSLRDLGVSAFDGSNRERGALARANLALRDLIREVRCHPDGRAVLHFDDYGKHLTFEGARPNITAWQVIPSLNVSAPGVDPYAADAKTAVPLPTALAR